MAKTKKTSLSAEEREELRIIDGLRSDPFYLYRRVMQARPVMPQGELVEVYHAIERERRSLYYGFAFQPSFLDRVRAAVLWAQEDVENRESFVFHSFRKKTLRPDDFPFDRLIGDFTDGHDAAFELATRDRERKALEANGTAHANGTVRPQKGIADEELVRRVQLAWQDLTDADVAVEQLDRCMEEVRDESQSDADFLAEIGAIERRIARLEAHVTYSNLRYIFFVDRKVTWRHFFSLEDRYSAGLEGLLKAVRRYRYRHGFTFGSYAHYWIRQAIQRAILDTSRLVRIPVNRWTRLGEVVDLRGKQASGHEDPRRVVEALEQPTPDGERRTSKDEAWMTFQLSTPLSLDAPIEGRNGEDGSTLADFLPDHRDPLSEMRQRMRAERMAEVLATLDEREARIIRMRFGIGQPQMTLDEVGNVFSLTRERVRQIEAKALAKLRLPSRAERLRELEERFNSIKEV